MGSFQVNTKKINHITEWRKTSPRLKWHCFRVTRLFPFDDMLQVTGKETFFFSCGNEDSHFYPSLEILLSSTWAQPQATRTFNASPETRKSQQEHFREYWELGTAHICFAGGISIQSEAAWGTAVTRSHSVIGPGQGSRPALPLTPMRLFTAYLACLGLCFLILKLGLK